RHRTRITRGIAFVVAFLLITGAVFAATLVFDGSEHRTPTARAENPIIPVTAPPPPIVVPTPPVTEAPALPAPEAAPADPYENVPIVEIGEMEIPKIGLVHWDDVWIVDQHPGRTVTLFACHPPGSAEYRYVVFGELVTT